MHATARFFAELPDRPHDPVLERANGTIRFELSDDGKAQQWSVTIDHGDITVRSGDEAEGDLAVSCTVGGPRAMFDQIVTGEANAMAAMLRGELTFGGDLELLLLFQRLFPGPPGAVDPRARARVERSSR